MAALLISLAIILEGFSRTHLVELVSPSESIGVYPYPFEIKWVRLEQYVAQNGGVDVIVLGSSVVNTGIDPDIVAQTYYEKTGRKLRIFNFGVEGLTIIPNSTYARILVQKYHPALIIYGTIPRDYLAFHDQETTQQFLSTPWIQYQAGNSNFMGWLIDHSAALRHLLAYRNWMRPEFLLTQYSYAHRMSRTTPSGYEPDHFTATNLDQPPDPNNPDDQAIFAEYKDYQAAPSRLIYLQEILALQKKGQTQVIIMEMPMHPSFYAYMGGEAVHQDFQRVIAQTTASTSSIFIPANGKPAIPDSGHSDREHLNQVGAPILSVYLGQQLAELTELHGMLFTQTGQGGQ